MLRIYTSSIVEQRYIRPISFVGCISNSKLEFGIPMNSDNLLLVIELAEIYVGSIIEQRYIRLISFVGCISKSKLNFAIHSFLLYLLCSK